MPASYPADVLLVWRMIHPAIGPSGSQGLLLPSPLSLWPIWFLNLEQRPPPLLRNLSSVGDWTTRELMSLRNQVIRRAPISTVPLLISRISGDPGAVPSCTSGTPLLWLYRTAGRIVTASQPAASAWRRRITSDAIFASSRRSRRRNLDGRAPSCPPLSQWRPVLPTCLGL